MNFEEKLVARATKVSLDEERRMERFEYMMNRATWILGFEEYLRDRYGKPYSYCRKISDGFITIKDGKSRGLVNTKGEMIFRPQYYSICFIPGSKNFFRVITMKDNKYGIIDEQQNEIVPFGKYFWISLDIHEGMMRAKKKGGYIDLIDVEGNVILEDFNEIWNFKEGDDSLVVCPELTRYVISFENLKLIRQNVKLKKRPLDINKFLVFNEHLKEGAFHREELDPSFLE